MLSDLKKSNIRQKRSRAAPDSVSACLVTQAIEARRGTTHQTGRLIPRAAEPQTRGGDRRKGATSFLSPLNKKKIEARTETETGETPDQTKKREKGEIKSKEEGGEKRVSGGWRRRPLLPDTRQGGGGAWILGAPPCRPWPTTAAAPLYHAADLPQGSSSASLLQGSRRRSLLVVNLWNSVLFCFDLHMTLWIVAWTWVNWWKITVRILSMLPSDLDFLYE